MNMGRCRRRNEEAVENKYKFNLLCIIKIRLLILLYSLQMKLHEIVQTSHAGWERACGSDDGVDGGDGEGGGRGKDGECEIIKKSSS